MDLFTACWSEVKNIHLYSHKHKLNNSHLKLNKQQQCYTKLIHVKHCILYYNQTTVKSTFKVYLRSNGFEH